MGSLITYSAIAAKLAAMRGHFLTDDEFAVLAGMENVPAAVDYLKNDPAYADVFSGIENGELHRSQIEELLWHSLHNDFSRLYRFANGTQRKFLDLYFLHFEIDVMKRCLRDAVSGKRSELNFKSFEPFFRKHSHLDFTALTDSENLDEFLDSIQAKRSSKEAFSALNELIGGIDILEKAENLAPNSKGVMAIRRLEKIYHILRYYGVEKFVTFDLSMTGTYGYYTGIVFRGYTYGTGDAVVKGGRYDHLIEKFGKKSPSIGFAIVIDELVSALTRQKIRIVYPRKNTIIIYAEGRQLEAIRLAKDFRRKAKNAELLKKDENSGLEDYIRYGNDYYAGSLVYIEETGEVTMVNLVTGEQKIVNSTDRS